MHKISFSMNLKFMQFSYCVRFNFFLLKLIFNVGEEGGEVGVNKLFQFMKFLTSNLPLSALYSHKFYFYLIYTREIINLSILSR